MYLPELRFGGHAVKVSQSWAASGQLVSLSYVMATSTEALLSASGCEIVYPTACTSALAVSTLWPADLRPTARWAWHGSGVWTSLGTCRPS
jgi:hypothetical protein